MKQGLFSLYLNVRTFANSAVRRYAPMTVGVLILHVAQNLTAQNGPSLVDRNLVVRTVATGLDQPTTMAFLGPNDMLVLEKATGKVQRVIDGVIQTTPALDLVVNSASERGLLGIALHPDFPDQPA